jgi:hypothetical protein
MKMPVRQTILARPAMRLLQGARHKMGSLAQLKKLDDHSPIIAKLGNGFRP